MTESEIQRQIMDYLTARGIFHWRNNSGMRGKVRFGLEGSADIIGLLSCGRFLAIEVKAAKGVVSPKQEAFILAINASGGLAFVARSLDDVIAALS